MSPPEVPTPAAPAGAPPASIQPPATGGGSGPLIRKRAYLLAVVLIAANHYWLVQLEMVRYSFPTIISPFYNVVFSLLWVTLANLWLTKRQSRWALTRLELLALYAMLSVSSAFQSSDMLGVLMSLMGYAHYYQRGSWQQTFMPYLPDWLHVTDQTALKAYYVGNESMYRWEYLQAWAVPVLAWGAFSFVLLYTLLCLSALLSKHWIAHERLTYPIVELPFQMTGGPSFFQNKLMWLGFALTVATTTLNGLNYLYPSIPSIALKRQSIAAAFPDPPWNAMGATNLSFYPFAIAIAYMMPADLSFSCWVFYLLYKLERVAAAASGIGEEGSRFPYHEDQAFGAYLAIFMVAAWKSRSVLRSVWDWTKGTLARDDPAQPISERRAFWSVMLGLIFLIGFARAAGMSWWLAVVFFVVYMALAVLMSRIRAELGFPVIDLHYTQPHMAMTRLFGSSSFTARDLTVFGMFHWFNRVYRSHPMPHMAESFKLTDRLGSPARAMFNATVFAIAVAIPLGFWTYLHIYYNRGVGTSHVERWALGYGREITQRMTNWIQTPTLPDPGAQVAAVFGFGLASLLAVARSRWFWFPFHPLSYAVANGWGMHNLWSCVLVGWLLKMATLKMGGLQKYRQLIPFFLGLMLGEFVVGSFWTLLGVALDVRTYDFWP